MSDIVLMQEVDSSRYTVMEAERIANLILDIARFNNNKFTFT